MANGDCECVGHIIRFRGGGKAQKLGNHKADLFLIRIADSHDGGFDFRWSIFTPLQIALMGSEQDHAERFADIHRGGLVGREYESFRGHRIGFVLVDQGKHFSVDLSEAVDDSNPGSLDKSVGDRGDPRAFAMHDAVADALQTRIDSQDRHPAGILQIPAMPWL